MNTLIIRPLTPWAAKRLNDGSDKTYSAEYITNKRNAEDIIKTYLTKFEDDHSPRALVQLRYKYKWFIENQLKNIEYDIDDIEYNKKYITKCIINYSKIEIIEKRVDVNKMEIYYITNKDNINVMSLYNQADILHDLTLYENKLGDDLTRYTNLSYWSRLFMEVRFKETWMK